MRYAIVGCGSRHRMFRDALCGPYADRHQLVALCDSNPRRLALSAAEAGRPVATHDAADFKAMIAAERPDSIIVATPDHTHADYIVTALEAGCEVICEKPLATHPDQLARILDAQARTGGRITVTFNYRYSPARTQLREIIAAGTIGEVTAVDFRWHLDRIHGADYFRRWHRQKANSGGLLVHKASHHFDLLNWWLDSRPEQVNASARRAFYTPQTAADLGLAHPGPRCATCLDSAQCDFALVLDDDDNLRRLYREAEQADGYHRDLCVFDPAIGIEDTFQAHIRFASGASANYTLYAYAPWEGLEVTFIGTRGELTHRHTEVHGIFGGKRPPGEHESMATTLHLAGEAPRAVEIPEGSGDHGGADPVMLEDLFAPDRAGPDRHNRASDQRAGAWSILTDIAADRAAQSGVATDIGALIRDNALVGLTDPSRPEAGAA